MRKIFLLTLLFSCLLLAAACEAAQVTNVKWGVNKANVLRFVVDVTDTAGYAVDMEDNTLNLTVNAAKAAQAPSRGAVKSSMASSFQVVDKGSYSVVRVPLNKRISARDYKAFVLKKDPATNRPFRVVLDINPVVTGSSNGGVVTNRPVISNKPTKGSTNTVSRPTTTVKPGNTTVKKDTTVKKNSKTEQKNTTKKNSSTADSKNTSKATPATRDSATTATQPVLKASGKYRTSGGISGKIITLDAGHGGSDPGAIGSDGTKEKDITLPITKMVQELLEKKGAKVYMTRTTDVDVYGPNASDVDELRARVNVGEKYNSDLFVSLHINSSVNKNVGGFSTYYYPKTDNDLRIAKCIQDNLAANFGVDDLGVRQANFYVIKRISMPATLVEMCFISNEKELTLMKGAWFKKKTARLIAEAIEKYFA